MKYLRHLLAIVATLILLLPLFIFTAAPTGGGGGGGNTLPTTVNTVTEVANAATCNFSLGYICDVILAQAGTITITLTNIPTKQYVTIIEDTATNSTGGLGTTWSLSGGNVICPATSANGSSGDTASNCASPQNGFSQSAGKYTTTGFSDGTNVYLAGNGMYQTVAASHGNFNTVALGQNGLVGNWNGHITWNSASSGVGSLALSACGSAPSPILQSFSTDDAFGFTGGGGATSCTVTFNASFGRAVAISCSDQTGAHALQVAPNGAGTSVVISGFTAGDTISCIDVGL